MVNANNFDHKIDHILVVYFIYIYLTNVMEYDTYDDLQDNVLIYLDVLTHFLHN